LFSSLDPVASVAEAEKVCPRCERAFAHDIAFCPYDGSRLLCDEESDSLVGRDIDGRFTVTALLGKGGMGAVYLATQHPMEREVALKVLKPEVSKTVEVKKRFLREAKSSSRLTNPHTVSVIDFGQTDDGMLYLAMERLVGETLGAILKKDGALTEQRAQTIAMQLCESLAEAHAQGLVHRDVKPENIFLMNPGTPREFVKVLDFGIAKSMANTDETALTRTGMVCGTPEYMSPEHASGKGATPASDVYSVGVLLYQALCGVTPFAADSPMQVLIRHIQEPPPPLRERMGDRPLSVPMEALIERCLAKDPSRRPGDAEALLAELGALDEARAAGHRAATVEHASGAPLPHPSDDHPTVATPTPATPQAGPHPRTAQVDAPRDGTDDLLRAVRPSRWPWAVGLGALVLAALLAAWHFSSPDQPPPPADLAPAAAAVQPAAAVAPTPPAPAPTVAAPSTPAPASTPLPVVVTPAANASPAPVTVKPSTQPAVKPSPQPTAPTPAPSKGSSKASAAPAASGHAPTSVAASSGTRLRSVILDSAPGGAAVLVDGDLRGNTPTALTARVGARILVRKAGYREHELVLEAGGSSRLKVVLEPTDEAAIRKALEDGLK